MMGSINRRILGQYSFYVTFLEKGRKPEKRREPRGRLRFLLYKVRVRLTLIKIKCMMPEITINMFRIGFESF